MEVSVAPPQLEHDALVRRVKLISWLSLGWMTAEGAIGVTAGIMANSIALIGYGLDSTIEGIASVVIIWRFTGDRIHSDDAETRAQKIVAATFFLLAPYIMVSANQHLATGNQARASWVGISLAIVSMTLMPQFGRTKKRLGNRLRSNATAGEGTQNILCAYLSLAILIGLSANALFGLWWAEPARCPHRRRPSRRQNLARRSLRRHLLDQARLGQFANDARAFAALTTQAWT
jgi:divalent metal cation (Fe/Co/Zn/Cd) transporter